MTVSREEAYRLKGKLKGENKFWFNKMREAEAELKRLHAELKALGDEPAKERVAELRRKRHGKGIY